MTVYKSEDPNDSTPAGSSDVFQLIKVGLLDITRRVGQSSSDVILKFEQDQGKYKP